MSTKEQTSKKKNQYRKDKPWDNDTIDHWKLEQIKPQETVPFVEESSFSVLFPQYRQKYIQQSQGIIKKKMMEFGIKFQVNLLQGSMTVRTTKKTYDPYAIIKARDAIKLISRSVAYHQALRVLEDGIFCEVVKIRSYVRNKERFTKRRQRLIGPNGETLKALQLLTECYILVQGGTVCMIGSFKQIKVLRRIVVDTMLNIHPVYHIKQLMVKRQLSKDEGLKNQNWDKFLPKFKQIKKSHKKRNRINKKSGYQTFPPQQLPRQQDIKMQTGEYFLSEKENEEKKLQRKKDKQERKRQAKLSTQIEQKNQRKEIQNEKQREQSKHANFKKKKQPTIQQLQEKFITKPLKKIKF